MLRVVFSTGMIACRQSRLFIGKEHPVFFIDAGEAFCDGEGS